MATNQTIKLCECGCGQPAPIATKTSAFAGWVKGQPKRFIHNHHSRVRGDLWELIRSRCVPDGDCLVWRGTTNGNGYGTLRIRQRSHYVHRLAYEYFNGTIPEGLEIDHVRARGCRSRACCNVAHMEVVTHRTNTLRGYSPSARHARITHCPRGHAYDLVNTRFAHGCRQCRLCQRDRARLIRARRRAEKHP